MDKQNLVQPHRGILFSHEKEQSIDTITQINLQNVILSDTKAQILYDSTDVTYLEDTNSQTERR